MKRMNSVVFASLLVPALALAQPKTADEWYKEGETQYNLGEFEKAADAFKQGFAAESDDSKKPAYLYNVAQAYRQGNRCKDSAFFYKRYLVLKDQDTTKPLKPDKRVEIEARIAELEECAKTQATIAGKPPNNTIAPGPGTTKPAGPTTKPAGPTTTAKPAGPTTKPAGPTTTAKPAGSTTTARPAGPTTTAKPAGPTVGHVDDGGEDGVDGEVDDGGGISAWAPLEPKLFNARFVLGGTQIFAGDLDMGFRATFALTGGYPVFKQDKLLVDAGVTFTYTGIPFHNSMTDSGNLASFVGVLANSGATYNVMPKISARGDLGLGIMTFGGISDMGNPFTQHGLPTTGPLSMFALRVAASADYEITPNIVATATPFAFQYSPAKSGLREDIGAIIRLDFMVGVGYRM